MSTALHAEQTVTQETSTPTEQAPATGSEGASAQGTEGAAQAGTTEGSPSPGETAEGDAVVETPAFKAREKFKYRVFGSEEQKEEDIPAWLKTSMKDADTEKQAIELLEKAYGLEPVKAARAEVAKERDHFKTEFSKIQGTISDVRKVYQRGDIDSFLDKLAIPHERMLQWALDKVNYSQLPPEQKQLVDDRRNAERQAWSAEERLSSTEQNLFEQSRSAKQTSLQSSLARPDVSTFAQAFDQRAGQPGAFFNEVCAVGDLAWNQSKGKEDLSPDQAIDRVMKKWGNFIQPQAATTTVAPTAGQAGSQAGAGSQATTVIKTPGVIPNVQGKTTSPMKSSPRSIEDIKKLRDAHRA